jgi:transcriptional regulator with XRE-family HTH domain
MAKSVELGSLVRGYRHASGLTLEDLAHRSGVSVRTISDLERGRIRRPHAHTIAALATALRLDDADRKVLLAVPHGTFRRPTEPAPLTQLPLCQLPHDLPDFAGRPAEAATIASWLTELRGTAIPVVISGAGGLGKTALAVHCAYRTRDDFPDGRLFVDLGGSGADPLDPCIAQFRLLRALGLAAADIPEGGTDRGQLLRHALERRRVLLVLDNAADEAQVRSLVPGHGGSAVLVTSRRTLAGLEHSRRMQLGPFSDGQAQEMLRAVIAAGGTMVSDLQGLRSVARLCGNYPLALRIAGNRVLSRPAWGLAATADELADEERRLDCLTAGDLQIMAAFSSCYGRLEPMTRLLFRRLALVPGADSGLLLASVLTGQPVHDVTRRLDDLIEAGLLISTPGRRAGFHDLIRLFARRQLQAHDTSDAVEDATGRMVTWLLATARSAAASQQGRQPDAVASAHPGPRLEFPDEAAAWRWLDAESENWLGALRLASGRGDHAAVVATVDALSGAFTERMTWHGWATAFDMAAAAADCLGEPERARRYWLMLAEPAAETHADVPVQTPAMAARSARHLALAAG